MSLLKVENLSLESSSGLALVKNLSFEIAKRETLVILGESGSGKTLTSLAILDLLPNSVIKTSGTIWINDVEFSPCMRGSQISMIMQAPATCFDQVHSIRTIFSDALKSHPDNKIEISDAQFIKMLETVELPNPAEILNSFAFQLSGGTLQRLMIALSLALNPSIIIADEATSDIDIVAQREILKLLNRLTNQTTRDKKEKGFLFITHDLSVAKQMADEIIVMQNGEKIDEFPVQDLNKENRHPYTKKLLLAHTNLNANLWGVNLSE